MTPERRKELEERALQWWISVGVADDLVYLLCEVDREAEERGRREAAGIVRGYVGTGPILAEMEKFWAGDGWKPQR